MQPLLGFNLTRNKIALPLSVDAQEAIICAANYTYIKRTDHSTCQALVW